MFASLSANAIGIVFTEQECANQDVAADMSTTGTPISSVINVTQDNQDNTFDLVITGGIPRLSNLTNEVCIEKKLAFGHTTMTSEPEPIVPTPSNPILTPTPLESVTGIAWFNGDDLVVSLTAIVFGDGPIINGAQVESSLIFPINIVLILNHNELDGSFKLVSLIRSLGGHASAVDTSQGFYADLISPASFSHREVKANVVYTIIE